MPKGILERLAEGPVLGDGGYLLELEKRGYVQAGPFTPEVVIEHPDALEQLHREFLRAGVDVLQTMTFYASDDKLATVGLEGKVDDINRNAVQIARKVAAEGDALVAGNLCLTWAYDPADPASADHVRALFDRQLQDQLDAGRRGLLDRRDVLVRAGGDPVHRTGEGHRAAGDGDDVLRAARCRSRTRATRPPTARASSPTPGADIVGVNCLNGPEQMLPIAVEMRGAVSGYVAAQPVALPHHGRAAGLHRDGRTSRTSSIRCRSPARRWATSPATRRTPASTTSARAAAPCRATSARWRKVLGKLPAEEREWKSTTGKAMSAYEYHEHSETEV